MLWKWFRKNSTQSAPHLELGAIGEACAAKHLRRCGYKILVKSFRSKSGEIDLVARDGKILVFVEVKTRTSEQFGSPSYAVNDAKQRHITKVALDYLRLLGNPHIHFRFDIVEVILSEEGRRIPDKIRVFQNAFDMTKPFFY